MKYKQKYLDKVYKNPITNFSAIIDISVYFDTVGKLDYSSEAVASIHQLDDDIITNMLIKDFQNRDKESIKNYGYQRLWWSLINTEKTSVYTIIKSNINEPIIDMFNYWLKELFMIVFVIKASFIFKKFWSKLN